MVLLLDGRLRLRLRPADCLESILWHRYRSLSSLAPFLSFCLDFVEKPSEAVLSRIIASVESPLVEAFRMESLGLLHSIASDPNFSPNLVFEGGSSENVLLTSVTSVPIASR